jgi:glyoxylase-like metal-dependent hydrolase (beta-lactamase superfamily II)
MCGYHDNPGARSRQRFPLNGLVAQSRIAYQTAPLLRHEIRPGLFVFAGAGGAVTAVAGAEAVAVVDTGYGPRVAEIRRAIAAALPREPKGLIDTHWHFDHTDGNAAFAAAGAAIVAHSNCRKRLSHTQYVPSLDWEIPASPPGAWPIATCDGPVSIDLGAQPVRLLPQRPPHTDGDLVVHLPPANVLVVGDLLTTAGYLVIDESSGGTLRGRPKQSRAYFRWSTTIRSSCRAMARWQTETACSASWTCCARSKAACSLSSRQTSPLPRSLPPRRPRSSTRAGALDASPDRTSPEWCSLASA